MTHIIEVPFHIGDFLSGTMHMDGTEIGAFWLLCVAHYQAGVEGLPDEDKQLARIAKVTPRVWVRIRPIIAEKFDIVDGRWTQKRVLEVTQKIANKSAENSAKSLKRWNAGDATALPRQSQPKTKNHKPIEKDNPNGLSKKPTFEELTVDHIADWLAEKRTNGRYLTIDEHALLEKFKDYCRSKNPKYRDYVAAFRNSFEWNNAPAKGGPTHERPVRESTKERNAREAAELLESFRRKQDHAGSHGDYQRAEGFRA